MNDGEAIYCTCRSVRTSKQSFHQPATAHTLSTRLDSPSHPADQTMRGSVTEHALSHCASRNLFELLSVFRNPVSASHTLCLSLSHTHSLPHSLFALLLFCPEPCSYTRLTTTRCSEHILTLDTRHLLMNCLLLDAFFRIIIATLENRCLGVALTVLAQLK